MLDLWEWNQGRTSVRHRRRPVRHRRRDQCEGEGEPERRDDRPSAVITARPGVNRGPPEGDGPQACALATAPQAPKQADMQRYVLWSSSGEGLETSHAGHERARARALQAAGALSSALTWKANPDNELVNSSACPNHSFSLFMV